MSGPADPRSLPDDGLGQGPEAPSVDVDTATREQPTTVLAAGTNVDGYVHGVQTRQPERALVDPSPYRTRCGHRVLEIYNDRREITCPACADG